MKVILFFGVFFFYSFSSQALCVLSAKAHLRSGPGKQHKITWTVGRYMPLAEESRKGAWVKVKDMDGQRHWVHRQNVTNRWKCVVVNKNKSLVRTGPGASYDLARPRFTERYTPLKRLESDNGWYKVENSWGEKFWVSRSHVWRPTRLLKMTF